MSEDRREIVLGFGVIGAGLVFGVLLLTGLHDRLIPGTIIHVDFDHTSALKESAPVQISGHLVGKVRAVRLGVSADEPRAQARVRVDLLLRRSWLGHVHRNSEIYIAARGLIGEQYVEIGPPRGAPGHPVRSGEVLRGTDPVRTDELVTKMYTSIKLTWELLRTEESTIRGFLRAQAALSKTIDTIADREKLRRVTAQVLDTWRGGLALVDVVREGTDDLEAVARVGANLGFVRTHAAELGEIHGRSDAALGALADLLDLWTPKRRENLMSLLATVRAATKRAQAAIGDLEWMFAQIARGKTSIGKLMQDRTLVDELKEVHRLLKQQPLRVLGKPPKRER